MNRGSSSPLPQWLSRQKARMTADWLHLVLLTAPRLAGPINVALRMYLGDLFDRLVIILHNPDAPISACVGEDFHIRYRDMPEFDVEDFLHLFKCGKNSIDVPLQQEIVSGRFEVDLNVVEIELEWGFKHLRHTEMEALRKHEALFTHFSGFESFFEVDYAFEEEHKAKPKGSTYPWALRS